MTADARPSAAIGGVVGRLRRVLRGALACALACLCACWSTPVEHIPESTSVYDVLPDEPRLRFDEARLDMEAGRLDLAQATLTELSRELPDNIVVGIWLQEVEIALFTGTATTTPGSPAPPGSAVPASAVAPSSGGSPSSTAPASPAQIGSSPASSSPAGSPHAASSSASSFQVSAPSPTAAPTVGGMSGAGGARERGMDELRQRYRRAAEAQPSAARFVLAARLENDELAANILLDRARGIDRRCAWVYYARAWFAARANRWPEVKTEIAAAKAADPGHMPTRWLDAWMLARGGEVREAMSALEGWIVKARGDLRLDERMLREAELDLALLSILDGDPEEAREILDGLGEGDVDPGRRWAAIAPTDQALDHEQEALAAAEHAEQSSPGEILPVVQQALLYESWLGQPEAAEAAWARALALARSSSDLAALLERVRARVHVERLRAAREKNARAERDAAREE